jgi:omega-amidase
MQDLRVTLVQTEQFWEDKVKNLNHFTDLLSTIEETDLIILPEMFHTGFSMNAETLAEGMEDSIGINWLKEKAIEKNAAFYTSLIIKEDGKFYNRGVFIEPLGKITTYDKRKTFGLAGEDKIYQAGTEKVVVNYKDWNIQLQICYDLRFPEISRNKLVDNKPLYDVLIYIANWPEKRSEHWKSLLQARAIENQSYVIGLNRVGKDANELTYSGDSVLIDALGEKTNLTHSKKEVKQLLLNLENLNKTRSILPFLKDA